MTRSGGADPQRLASSERRLDADREPVVDESATVVEHPPGCVVGDVRPVVAARDLKNAVEREVCDARDQVVDAAADCVVDGVEFEVQDRGIGERECIVDGECAGAAPRGDDASVEDRHADVGDAVAATLLTRAVVAVPS